jgi:hypothetical protein
MKRGLPAALLTLLVTLRVCTATTFLELESSYLGDGWFRYRMKTHEDPFFSRADINHFVPIFTNFVEYGPPPAEWTNAPISNWAPYWGYELGRPVPQIRPYEREFFIRSAAQSFRRGTNSMVLMDLNLNSMEDMLWREYMSVNIVGYATIPCLTPCVPEDADGSPTNMIHFLKLIPDIEITQLLVTNGTVFGIEYFWNGRSTVLLQASFDAHAWTNIAYIEGSGGLTTWVSPVPLNDAGSMFRVQLVEATASQTATSSPANTQEAVPWNFRPNENEVVVEFQSKPAVSYVIQALTIQGNVVESETVAGTGERVSASFTKGNLPNPVFFVVKRNL